ncbi:uncharacterized protein F5147DRAFT_574833 [Suillus discolor]|uniref:DUF6570 domain-containing protein n=1 Tax=Suillus discolor TaxID=1912936 RepID=A0A9P7JV42_9AGAM|nr:uncharacterized protein F5147DRAFT_574833 [Suillus discolor]KAG2110212.1 hypothetical protein F5147DRAFT_574833 [Suillus discolor]
MIARCRAKCWIIQLKEENQDLQLSTNQCGIKGHIIVYPQHPEGIANILPLSVDDIIMLICIIFVGSCPPTRAWLEEKAKPLIARREKVHAALVWLKEHNHLYKDITIDFDVLNSMEDKMLMPFHIDHVLPNDACDFLTLKYDATKSVQSEDSSNLEATFENVVVTDVDGNASANELRAAAVHHIKNKGGGYVQVPHNPQPVNEFFNLNLFPMIYPTLFPYGLGGFEDHLRPEPLLIKRHVKHLFNLADCRFQEHYSFLFMAFNILQRQKILLHTSLKVNRDSFPTVATNLTAKWAVHCVTECVA